MIISTVFQAVYAVISLLKLQFVILVSVLWLILHFTGITVKYPIANLFLSLALIASVIYAVVSILKALLGLGGKKKKRRGAQLVKSSKRAAKEDDDTVAETATSVSENTFNNAAAAAATPVQPSAQVAAERVEEPKYFRVKQNPDLVMAEYGDRYELYKISGGSLVKIRTDFK